MITTTNNTTEGSGSSPSSCHTFNAEQLWSVIIVYASESFAAAVACLIAIVIILSLKLHRKFAHRLLLYVLIVAFFQAISLAFQVVPIHHSGVEVQVLHGLDDLCTAVGFFTQFTASQLVLVLVWILVYLFLLVVCKYPANSKRHEIAGLVITLGLPLLVDWLPLIHNLYGLAGAWCWIRTTGSDCNHLIDEGVAYQALLFYGPLTLLLLSSFLMFLVILFTLARNYCKHSGGDSPASGSPYQQAVKEAIPLVLYPVLYNLIVGVMIANRVKYAVDIAHGNEPDFPLFLAAVICDPLRILFIPLAFLLHPGTVRKLWQKISHQENALSEGSETNYPVPPDPDISDTDVEPLVIRGRGNSSTYRTTSYMSIFDSDS